MEQLTGIEPTHLDGIHYYDAPQDAMLVLRDGALQVPYGGLPIPLLAEDFETLQGDAPSYDMIGQGVYQALRMNPACTFAERYADLLKEAYPHVVSEMATQLLMLDKKDVEAPYLDRKISHLRVFALLQPDEVRFPLEIGKTFLGKGLCLSVLHLATENLYQAHAWLGRALELAPDDPEVTGTLANVSYILGYYDVAVRFWQATLARSEGARRQELGERLERLAAGDRMRVPAVDYLQAIGGAFSAFVAGDHEDAAAILYDVLADPVFSREFPIPQLPYTLGLCYATMELPRYAEEMFTEALRLDPGYAEARAALAALSS